MSRSGHRGLRHRNPQFAQFSVNAGCTPQGVGLAHASNQITNVPRNFWPAGMAARFSGPMPGESAAVPTEDSVGLNHLVPKESSGADRGHRFFHRADGDLPGPVRLRRASTRAAPGAALRGDGTSYAGVDHAADAGSVSLGPGVAICAA